MTDTKEEIENKFKKAFCPAKQAKDNPVLEYCRYIIFEKNNEFKIERPEKFGGNATFKSYEELETAFIEGKVHPMDLKNSAAKYIDGLIAPVRKHFAEDKKAKELLAKVQSFF